MEVKIRMWSLNLGKPKTIPQLNESMAIDLGATLLGEIILFAVPATVLVFEYLRLMTTEFTEKAINRIILTDMFERNP